jgi:hypothetical protein
MGNKRNEDALLEEIDRCLRETGHADLGEKLLDAFMSETRKKWRKKEERKGLVWAMVVSAELCKARGIPDVRRNSDLFIRIGNATGIGKRSTVLSVYREMDKTDGAKAVRARLGLPVQK